ncbi:unnamed protein product [Zymoseptoria tritici ST99CH_3D7]|uniref:F-box domain-containing protein n=1 Tax=Zymoseptoria tritici (strain ST99CH_3D7) TaxID=1276538 RepID=A0A1X7RJS7_ZYMT9|nr:unnamed protein product [Zymoseptoria tritici ST99CH_3D7]
MILLLRKEQPPLELSSMADQTASRLLLLPAELRNAIWELLLVHTIPFPPQRQHNRSFCANILQTCKQINHEATPILYAENTFMAHPSLLAALPAFLLTPRDRVTLPPVVKSRVASLIRRYYIHVRLDVDPRFSQNQVTESFTGVDALEIEVFQAMYGSCDFTTLKMFEDVRGVGKAVVQGSIGDGNYARYLEMCMTSPPGTDIPPFSEELTGGGKGWSAWLQVHR